VLGITVLSSFTLITVYHCFLFLSLQVSLKCQSICQCCVSLEQLYAEIREPLPSEDDEMPPSTTSTSPRTQTPPVRREPAADMSTIIARTVNNDVGVEVPRLTADVSARSDDNFYRVETDRSASETNAY
jgi:hypothetical protein